MTRSASAIASSRAGSAPATRTSEPPVTSGRETAATPGGEAGFAVNRSRSPPVEFRELPAATGLPRARPGSPGRPQRHVGSGPGGSYGVNASGCPHTSTPTSWTPGGSGSANRTPMGSREQASTGRSSARGAQVGQASRAAHDGVRRHPRGRERHRQPGGPGGAEEDRSQPVARQVDEQHVTALQVVLLDEQRGGLGHPVGVRRHRQLDALAGAVVVEREAGGPGRGAARQPGAGRRWASWQPSREVSPLVR